MQTVPVGIIGASGYSGLELSRILALHPHVELKLLGSDRWAGESAAARRTARREIFTSRLLRISFAPVTDCTN